MKLKIKVVSDLHLEFSQYLVPNAEGADVLILSGDICIANDLHSHSPPDNNAWDVSGAIPGLGPRQQKVKKFREFFKHCSENFKDVVYVMGNHEFYHGKFYASIDHIREEIANYPNIHFLEQEMVEIDDVIFVGGTLWTDCNRGDPLSMHVIQEFMNDYKLIRNDRMGYTKLRTAHTMERFMRTKEYINHVLCENQDRRIVVVTHHAPSGMSVMDRYRSEFHENGGYRSELSDLILDNPQIKLWTHGHMHNPSDYMIGDTRIICNPRGYQGDGYSEDTGFDETLTVEV
jgi:Icc-related predicted phosphoesterase